MADSPVAGDDMRWDSRGTPLVTQVFFMSWLVLTSR